eukprot:7388034-Prymnesium_polylepis.1
MPSAQHDWFASRSAHLSSSSHVGRRRRVNRDANWVATWVAMRCCRLLVVALSLRFRGPRQWDTVERARSVQVYSTA